MTDMEFIKTKTSKIDPVVKKDKQTPNFVIERNSRVNEEIGNAYLKSLSESLSGILDRLDEQIEILTNFLQDNQLSTDPKMLLIPDKNGCEFISVDELVTVKGEGKYSQLFLKDGSIRVVTKSLKEIAEMVDCNQFCQTHQSWMVNKKDIKRIQPDRHRIITKTDQEIPIARSMMASVKAKFRLI